MPLLDEAAFQAATFAHLDKIDRSCTVSGLSYKDERINQAIDSFRAGAAFAAEQLSPAWVTAAEVDEPGWWWWQPYSWSAATMREVQMVLNPARPMAQFSPDRPLKLVTELGGLWTPAFVPTPPVSEKTVGQQLVDGLASFTEKLESGEPIEVTRVSVEHTPDGPLTTAEKGVL